MNKIKRHVGRPRKEEVIIKKKIKKAKIIGVIAVILTLIAVTSLFIFRDKINFGAIMANSVTNHNNYIIVVGASQVGKMNSHVNSIVSSKNNYYKKPKNNNKTDINLKNGNNLFFIYANGSGIPYQYYSVGNKDSKGSILWYVNEITKYKKNAVIHVFFPLSGNSIVNWSCSEISKGESKNKKGEVDATLDEYVNGYYNAILELKKINKNIYGYVTAMHPDDPWQAKQINPKTKKVYSSSVVYNNDSRACNEGYRSNEKSYKFNLAIQSRVSDIDKNILMYEPLFIQVMKISNPDTNYSYKIKYGTTDGIHWDENSTKDWLKRMIDYSGRL